MNIHEGRPARICVVICRQCGWTDWHEDWPDSTLELALAIMACAERHMYKNKNEACNSRVKRRGTSLDELDGFEGCVADE